MICDTVDLYTYFSRPREGAAAGKLKRFLHGQITESASCRPWPFPLLSILSAAA